MKLAVVFALLFATPALAQDVGYSPENSPYRDIPTPQRLSVFAGYFSTSQDKIGAIPKSAPLIGVRYEVTVGGPAQFFARVAYANSKRNSFDPTQTEPNRPLGEAKVPILLTDVGFSFNLTGQKSWHNFVPTVGFAAGAVNSRKRNDLDPFRLGTQFTLSTDFGIRYLFENALEARVNVGNTFYQTRYPNSYFTQATDGTSLLPSTTERSKFRNNWMFSTGLAFPIFR